jgi:hypothetical protein
VKAYRALWLVLWSVLGAAGAAAVVVWSVGMALLILGLAAGFGVVVAMVRFGPDDSTEPFSDQARQMMVRYSLVGGSAAVAVSGFAALLGAWAAALLLAMCAVCSPTAIGLYQRRRPKPVEPTTPARLHSRIADEAPPDAEIEAEPGRPAPAVVEPGLLNDTELCLAWRASFSALQRASSRQERLSIIEHRRALLDELERRSPHGLMAWLASGARAAGDPSRFIVDGNGTGRSVIDWDALTQGPDR